MAAVRGVLGLRLTIAALERQAERDLAFELRPDAFEEREDRTSGRCDGRTVAWRNSRQRGGGAAKLLSHRGWEAGLRRTSRGGRFRVRAEGIEAAAGRQQCPSHCFGLRASARGLPQLTDGRALKVEETRSLLGIHSSCRRLLPRRRMGGDEGAEGTERCR